LQAGQVLKIINTFEPTPLMLLLKKQGFDSHAEQLSDNLAETWFDKKEEFPKIKEPEEIQLQSTHN
jgi:uncharacterized protein (DUF2249 family)